MANAAVSEGKSCVGVVVGPCPFFLVVLLLGRRNASLAGGFAGRLVVWWWFCFCDLICPFLVQANCAYVPFFSPLMSLSGPCHSAITANPEEKKLCSLFCFPFRCALLHFDSHMDCVKVQSALSCGLPKRRHCMILIINFREVTTCGTTWRKPRRCRTEKNAFRRVALETSEWTSRDSNHHRHSVSAGKTNAIPTEPSGRLTHIRREGPQLDQNATRKRGGPNAGRQAHPTRTKPQAASIHEILCDETCSRDQKYNGAFTIE